MGWTCRGLRAAGQSMLSYLTQPRLIIIEGGVKTHDDVACGCERIHGGTRRAEPSGYRSWVATGMSPGRTPQDTRVTLSDRVEPSQGGLYRTLVRSTPFHKLTEISVTTPWTRGIAPPTGAATSFLSES